MIFRKNLFGIAMSAVFFTLAAPASALDLDIVDDLLGSVGDFCNDLDIGSVLDLDGGVIGDDNGSDTDVNDNASDSDSNILTNVLDGSDSDGIDIDDSLDGSPAIIKANEIVSGSDSDVVDADGDNKVGSNNDLALGDLGL